MKNNRLPKNYLSIAGLAALSLTGKAWANPETPPPGQEMDYFFNLSLEQLALIKVQIGSRSTEGRPSLQSPVPVDIITAQDLERSGFNDLTKVLNRLLPSLSFASAAINDASEHQRPFSLRGMKSDQVLVLVNGKRRHQGSVLFINAEPQLGATGVDLSNIPLRSVERVEVLRDGAAAQYGSDAIAGIINIVLKQDTPTRLSTTHGSMAEGDGETRQVDINTGVDLPGDGFLHLSAEFRERGRTNRSGPDNRPYYFVGDPRNNEPRRVTHIVGEPETRDLMLALNAETSPSQHLSLYGFSTLDWRRGRSTGYFRRPLDDRTVRAVYPDGFLPGMAPDIFDAALSVGAKGKHVGWDWDLSNTWGANRFDFNIENSVNTSLGSASPTRFDSGGLGFSQNTTNLDFFRYFDIGREYPLSLGWGLEMRAERYKIRAGEESSYIDGGVPVLDGPNVGADTAAGAQFFPGFSPVNAGTAQRRSYALYLDLEHRLNPDLLGQVAARVEHYSDFGSTLNGKLALAYQARPGVTLRSSTSTGFRAPSLAQAHYYSTMTSFVPADARLTEVGIFPVDHPLARQLGATDLNAEESRHFTLGTVLTPNQRLSFTADYFYTEIDKRIVFSGYISPDPALFPAEVVAALNDAGVGWARYFTNAVDTRTQGVDLALRYEPEWPAAVGQLKLSAQYNYNRSEVLDTPRTPAILGEAGPDIVLNSAQQEHLVETQPHSKLIFTADYQRHGFNLLARLTRFGSVANTLDSTPGDRSGGQWVADLELAYRFRNNLQVAVGAENVFDRYPDFVPYDPPFNGQDTIFPYSSRSPFGYNGAFYYLRLSAEF